MWGRYLEIGLVWCGLVLHCSPRLIMSGLSNGCLGLGRAAWLPDKSPPNFSSRLWTGMVSGNLSEFLVVNSKLCVQLRLIDLCKRIKLKHHFCFRSVIRSILQLDFAFFYHLLHVCRLYVPLHVTWPLLTSAPRSPHFLFEVSWTGWRAWLRASQMVGLGPCTAKEPICSYLRISQVEVIEGAIRF